MCGENQGILEAIRNRRSIREFTDETVDLADLKRIVEAGIWAPSGKNNQPCRFVLITDQDVRGQVAEQTIYTGMVNGAPALIAVYVDESVMYDQVKDQQSAGAALQNMLLAAEALGLGSVWLGQILKNKTEVSRILGVGAQYDLMAVVVIGHPLHRNQTSQRMEFDHFILGQFGG